MIEVRIPATSANMGPGFDCIGVALNMYNSFCVEEIESGLDIQGCDEAHTNENNIVYTSIQKCFNKMGYDYKNKGLRIKVKSDIPSSRGLGSSAACIVGGILCANELAGRKLSRDELLELACEIEGHPDNTTPALLGGMTVAVSHEQRVFYERVDISRALRFCCIMPDFALSTKTARAILPETVSLKDAVFNIGRASLLITAMANENYELIRYACMDKLHQPYRAAYVSGYYALMEELQRLGCLGAFLSGAGPSIIAIVHEDNPSFIEGLKKFLPSLESKWIAKELKVDFEGARIVNRT